MKLLLTSAGFENQKIAKKFLELLNKPISEVKVVFIPTAARTPEEVEYIKKAKKEIIVTGVKSKNIKTLNLDHPVDYTEVRGFDAIYVCGGNTFFLLKKVKESGFDKILKEFLEEGKLYVGVSAGSIIVGPDIEIAGWGSEADINDIELKDLKGLNFTSLAVYPHYKVRLKKEIENYRKRVAYEVVTLTDRQALLILSGIQEFIT